MRQEHKSTLINMRAHSSRHPYGEGTCSMKAENNQTLTDTWKDEYRRVITCMLLLGA